MGKTRIKSYGITGDRHAQKYFSNTLLASDYILASNTDCRELQTEVNVKITKPPVKENGKWFVEVNNQHILPTNALYKPFTVNRLQAEDNTFNNLNNKITEIKKENNIDSIRLFSNTFCRPIEINNVEKVKGFQKADIVFVDTENKPVIFTSLKKTYNARGTWGYGGLSSKRKHPALQEFLTKLNITEHPERESFALELDTNNSIHRNLIMLTMYGNDYGAASYGINNVDNIVFGEIDLDFYDDTCYYMKAEKILMNGELDHKRLYIQTNFSADRNDCGIRNATVQLRHKGSRKVTQFV